MVKKFDDLDDDVIRIVISFTDPFAQYSSICKCTKTMFQERYKLHICETKKYWEQLYRQKTPSIIQKIMAGNCTTECFPHELELIKMLVKRRVCIKSEYLVRKLKRACHERNRNNIRLIAIEAAIAANKFLRYK